MAKRKIALVMQELLYHDEQRFVYSGGDRYSRDLALLIKSMGIEPVVFQKSTKYQYRKNANGELLVDANGKKVPIMGRDGNQITEFMDTEWEGVRVVGLPSATPADLNMDVAQNTQEFDATIYFNILLGYPRVHRRSVSISHGIWFDHVKMPPASDDKWDKFRTHLQSCVSGVDYVVSVDTNTINFFGGLFAGRYAHKFVHIPNAVDSKMYRPALTPPDKTIVLYPRRWEILRGQTEMMRLVDELGPKYPKVEFHLCGRAHSDAEEAAVTTWANQSPNTKWYWKPFDEMPAVYQSASIAVIPTIGAEGTSYSAIEALASGLPVVSTYVGGLSELVIDGFNGIKVAPRYEEIKNAVQYLIDHPLERKRMGENARKTGEAFDKKKWDDRWKILIKDLIR